MGQILILSGGTYVAGIDFPIGISMQIVAVGGGGGAGGGAGGRDGFNDVDGEGGEAGLVGTAGVVAITDAVFADTEEVTFSFTPETGAGGPGGSDDNDGHPGLAGSAVAVVGHVTLDAPGGVGGAGGPSFVDGTTGESGFPGMAGYKTGVSSGAGGPGHEPDEGGEGGYGGAAALGYGASGGSGGGGGGGKGHWSDPGNGGTGGAGGAGAPAAGYIYWDDAPTEGDEFRINGSIVPQNGTVRMYSPDLDPVIYPDGYVEVDRVMENGSEVWFKPKVVPTPITDFAASIDQIGQITVTWTDVLDAGNVNYTLMEGAVEIISNIDSGYVYNIVAGSYDLHVKATNVVGSSDSNIFTGISL